MSDFARAIGIFVAVGVAAAGFAACSQSGDPPALESSVAVSKQALGPGKAPNQLSKPLAAWYVASPNNTDITFNPGGTRVATWIDRTGQGHNLTQDTDTWRPLYQAQGWNGHPTLTFQGQTVIHYDAWTGPPNGTNAPFTILAVVRYALPANSTHPVDSDVVSWWDPNGGGNLWAGFKADGDRVLPDFYRAHEFVWAQDYTGPHDLSTVGHVIAWRFQPTSPTSQILDITVDGTKSESRPYVAVESIPNLPFIVGAASTLPTHLFTGDLSELAIVSDAATDQDIQDFTDYARTQWGGLPTQSSNDPCTTWNGTSIAAPLRCDDGVGTTVADSCATGTCSGTAPLAHNPTELGPVAWYHANAQEVFLRDNLVSHWYDRTTNKLDLLEGFYVGQPTLNVTGWNAGSSNPKPTIHFNGSVLRRASWSGAVSGLETPFTVLAVVQGLTNQNAAVASWWTYNGGGMASCLLKTSSTSSTLDLFRQDEGLTTQDFPDTRQVDNGRHVLAWRYTSGSAKITVDGATATIANPSSVGSIGGTEFLVGAQNDFSYSLLHGDISELVVIPNLITDAQIDTFDDYAENEWGGLTFCTRTCGPGTAGAADGCGGTCPGANPGDTCVADPDCAGGVHCASGVCGGSGAGCPPACAPGLSCENGVCNCVASCDGKLCGESNGCGDTCRCSAGTTGCLGNNDCEAGLVCQAGTCVTQACLENPILAGCGYPGAPCGQQCTPHPFCTGDADCPSGYICPPANGWKYGVAGFRVCELPGCGDPNSGLACGTPTSECGVCDCVPQCAGKHCGDADLSDHCGGQCPAVCGPSDVGCQRDSDCSGGYICLEQQCRPADPCGKPDLAEPLCGPGTECGPCPIKHLSPTSEAICGANIGGCPGGQFCNAAGQCAKLEQTPAISVTMGDGVPRDITPTAAPGAVPIGATPGNFSVSDWGSAMYSIPIEVPPGRFIQPALSLRYASSTANGELGIGWSIDGLSTIARCQQTYAQDGYTAPVDGTDGDGLCIDGQRLKRDESTGFYYTMVDSFVRVQAVPQGGQPLHHFVAYTKDGRILTYGGSDSSRSILKVATVNGNAVPVIGTWGLSRVEDRKGNFMRIVYRNDLRHDAVTGTDTTAEMVPSVVTYTGFGPIDGDREVVFTYHDEPRLDSLAGWRPGGGAWGRRLLLDHVDVRAQNQFLRRYQLAHEVANGGSRLTSVTECIGTATNCRTPTTFSYDSSIGFEHDTAWTYASSTDYWHGDELHSDPNAHYNVIPFGVVHKWGALDVVRVGAWNTYAYPASPFYGLASFAASFIPEVGPYLSMQIRMIELGAGTTESMYQEFDLNTDVHYTSGHKQLDVKLFDLTTPCSGPEPTPHVVQRDPVNGDFEDIFHVCPVQQQTGGVYEVCGVGGCVTLPKEKTFDPSVWFPDINGDGVQDKVFCSQDGTKLRWTKARPTTGDASPPLLADDGDQDGEIDEYSTTCEKHCDPSLENGNCFVPRQFSTVFDVNGDGTSDLVVYDGSSAAQGWAALIFDRSGHPAWRHDLLVGVNILPDNRYYVVVLDANGDGLKDILGLPDRTVDASRPALIEWNTGGGFREEVLSGEVDAIVPDGVPGTWPYLSAAHTGVGEAPAFPAYVVDIDHDGVEELLEPISEHTAAWRVRRVKNGSLVGEYAPDLVAKPGTIGDFDGDGNLDVLAITPDGDIPGGHANTPNSMTFYRGKGRQNGLLKQITEGNGHQIDITYGAHPGTGLPSTECRWPQRCPGAVQHEIVASHTESNLYSGQVTLDKQVTYTYGKWLADMAGYGPIGFDSRTISESDAYGFTHEVKLEYAPGPVGISAVPYHRTNGLVRKRTDLSAQVESFLDAQISQLQVETTFDWQDAWSAIGNPFPHLAGRVTTTSLVTPEATIPMKRVSVVDSEVDGYGNSPRTHTEVIDLDAAPNALALMNTRYVTDVWRDYTLTASERSQWLISLLKSVKVDDTPPCADNNEECGAFTRERKWLYHYYDGTNLLHVIERSPEDTTSLYQRTELTRDDDPTGVVTKTVTTDKLGNVRETDVGYDQRSLFPITVTARGDGTSQTTQVRYDDRFGSLNVVTDPNGISSTWAYDELGIMRRHWGPDGTRSLEYGLAAPYTLSNPYGGLEVPAAYEATETVGGGAVTTVELNQFGQIVRRTTKGYSDKDVSEEFEYDPRHRLIYAWRPHLADDWNQSFVEYEYDNLNRVTDVTYPRYRTYHYDYGHAVNLWGTATEWVPEEWRTGGYSLRTVTDPDLNTTVSIFDSSGRLSLVRDAQQTRDGLTTGTMYTYGAFGHLTTIGSMNGTAVTIDQDAYDRTLQVDDPSRGGPEIMTYDGLDEVRTTQDHAYRTRSIHYDGFGRVKTIDDDGHTEYEYDGDSTRANEIGRLIRTTSSTGQVVTYTYEPLQATYNRGVLSTVSEQLHATNPGIGADGPRQLDTTYHYDATARLTEIEYPAQQSGERFKVDYQYDTYGHPLKVYDPDHPSNVYWEFGTDSEGYRIGTERIGTATCDQSDGPGTTTTRSYNLNTGLLEGISTQCHSDTPLQTLSYTHDNSGYVDSRNDGHTTEKYGYDPVHRLTTINNVETFTYDADNQGRLLSQLGVGIYSYEPFGYNWVHSAGEENTYLHDNVGNIWQRSGPSVPGNVQTIEYTSFDLPRSVTPANGDATYLYYDASESRVIKQAPSAATFYAGDLYQRIEAADGSTTHRHLVYGPEGAVAQVTELEHSDGTAEAPAVRFLYSDILGSIQTVADDHANVLSVRDYGPFGVNRLPPANDGVPYGFTGQEHDDDFGLINMHGRMYDPVLGQFTSADPVMQDPAGQGLNRFAYVNNSPLTFTDPSGFTIDGETENRIIGYSVLGAGWSVIGYGWVTGAIDAAGGSGAAAAGAVAFEGNTAIAGSAIGGGVADVVGSGDPLAEIAPLSQAPHAYDSLERAVSGNPHPRTQVGGNAVRHNGPRAPKGDGASPNAASGAQEAPPQKKCNEDNGCPVDGAADAAPANSRFSGVRPLVADVAPLFVDTHETWDDAAGLLAAVLPGPEELAVGMLSKVLGRAGSRALEAIQKHHAWPKYLGGPAKQKLVPLTRAIHEAYHSGLDRILPRQWGTKYYQALSAAEKQAALSDLAAYTRAFDAKYGTDLMGALRGAGFPGL